MWLDGYKILVDDEVFQEMEKDSVYSTFVPIHIEDYKRKDWGDTSEAGIEANEEALATGEGLVIARYKIYQDYLYISTKLGEGQTLVFINK